MALSVADNLCKESDVTSDSGRQLILDWASAWSSVDALDRFLSLFTEDVRYEDVAAGHELRGKAELEGFYRLSRNAFPDFKVSVTSFLIESDRACAEWEMTGTQLGDLPGLAATGKQISMRGVSVFERRDERLRRVTDYYDRATMLAQLNAP